MTNILQYPAKPLGTFPLDFSLQLEYHDNTSIFKLLQCELLNEPHFRILNCAKWANSGLNMPLETAEPYRNVPRTCKYSSLRVLLCQSNIISDGFSVKSLPLKDKYFEKLKKIAGDLDFDSVVEIDLCIIGFFYQGIFCGVKRSEGQSVV